MLGNTKFLIFILLGLGLYRPLEASFRPGDVILQPRRCYVCGLIERQERSIFSHMGMVVEVSGFEAWVLESLGEVRVVPLKVFLSQGDATRPHVLLRFKQAWQRFLPQEWSGEISPLLGASYDSDFLWDNLGSDGREAYYCSELITKLLNPFLPPEGQIPTKSMDYSLDYKLWVQLMGKAPPQGLPGNSPADFERSSLFDQLAIYESHTWNWNLKK
jgi:hypothetical protein